MRSILYVVLCLLSLLFIPINAQNIDVGSLLNSLNLDTKLNKRNKATNKPVYYHHPTYERDVCPTYPCNPKTHKTSIRESYKAFANGCGAYGVTLTAEQDEFKFTPCCDVHDICYGTCNSSRSKCDTDFAKCLNSICDKNYKKNTNKHNECKQTAQTYLGLAKSFGCSTFADSQREACTCEKHNNIQPSKNKEL